eukprot:g33387.t1
MDPAVFRSPADFRIDRADESPALTFGSGMHYCLGSNLVKLEMRLAGLQMSTLGTGDSTSKIGTQQVRDQEISWETPSGRLSFSSSIIPPFKGYAIYPRMAFMNHSCRPTCAIEFDYTAQIFVLQQPYNDMDKGTELTISYLDSSLDAQADLIAMGRKRRRQELLPYGIECSCELCEPLPKACRVRSRRKKLTVAKHGYVSFFLAGGSEYAC